MICDDIGVCINGILTLLPCLLCLFRWQGGLPVTSQVLLRQNEFRIKLDSFSDGLSYILLSVARWLIMKWKLLLMKIKLLFKKVQHQLTCFPLVLFPGNKWALNRFTDDRFILEDTACGVGKLTPMIRRCLQLAHTTHF